LLTTKKAHRTKNLLHGVVENQKLLEDGMGNAFFCSHPLWITPGQYSSGMWKWRGCSRHSTKQRITCASVIKQYESRGIGLLLKLQLSYIITISVQLEFLSILNLDKQQYDNILWTRLRFNSTILIQDGTQTVNNRATIMLLNSNN